MKDEDVDIGFVFNESVDFLFVWRLFDDKGDELLVGNNDLSELERFDKEDLRTRDVIIGGVGIECDDGDGEESLPILEHVWARRANGLWLESYYIEQIKKNLIKIMKFSFLN